MAQISTQRGDVIVLDLHRRDVIVQGGAALAAMAAFYSARSARAFPTRPGDVVIPWLDQPAAEPRPGGHRDPARLGGSRFLGDAERQVLHHRAFRSADHRRRQPGSSRSTAWSNTPLSLSLADIKARPRQEVTFTIECSGNHGFPVLHRRHRQRRLGRHAARRRPRGGGRDGERHRGRLLGHRRRRHRAPRRHPRREDAPELRAQHVARRRDEPRQHPLLRDERRGPAGAATAPRCG